MEGRFFGEGMEGIPSENIPETVQKFVNPQPEKPVQVPVFKNGILPLENKRILWEPNKNRDTVETGKENEPLNDQVLDRIIKAKITTDNGYDKAMEIIEELKIKDESLIETALIEAGIIEQLEMDKKIAALDHRKGNTHKEACEILVKRVERTKAIENFIEKHENEPEILENFWNHFDKIYFNRTDKFQNNYSIPDKNGIKASIGVRKLFKKLGIFHADITAKGDVYDGIDGYLEINGEIVPYQVKCRSLNVDSRKDLSGKYGIDKSLIERQKTIEEEMVSVVSDDLALKIRNAQNLKREGRGNTNFVSPIKKEIDREKDKFWEKILLHNQNNGAKVLFKKGIFVILPSGSAWNQKGEKISLLKDNGTVDERVENLFMKRYNQNVLGIDNIEESVKINTRKGKNRRNK